MTATVALFLARFLAWLAMVRDVLPPATLLCCRRVQAELPEACPAKVCQSSASAVNRAEAGFCLGE
jgi:hypothetical protein